MASTDWIFAGRDSYAEFIEKKTYDGDGVLLGVTMLKRDVYTFRRYRITTFTTGTTLTTGDLGTTGTPSAYKGAYLLTATAISTDGDRLWVCTADDTDESDFGCPWYVQRQTWEMREEPEEYDWPTYTAP